MKKFTIPSHYKSSIISEIKELRKIKDPRKKDFSPTLLNFGPVEFLIARHFGFCYGVENAIEIANKIIDDNPGKNIFLLSEMIHNPLVNKDLIDRGIRFILDNYGNQYIGWDEITPDDIVIVPAFGTTIEIEQLLKERRIDTQKYNTTCPFVEKVWNRADELGKKDFTVIIHGKAKHEETRATFSHSKQNAPSLIVFNMEEAEVLADVILGKKKSDFFLEYFKGKYSHNFDFEKDLMKIGVVNQTTMLASETEEIAEYLKNIVIQKYGKENIKNHFADTRDTLCYATNDNQSATLNLLEHDADIAIVAGGYNSSNTSHLYEILEKKFHTYFISGHEKIINQKTIQHFSLTRNSEIISYNFLSEKEKTTIAITSGASCPDSLVDEIIEKLLSFFDNTRSFEEVLYELRN